MALDTKQHKGPLELTDHSLPVELAGVGDLDALARDIQRAQGNNPTRRIRLSVSHFGEKQVRQVHEYVSRGPRVPGVGVVRAS